MTKMEIDALKELQKTYREAEKLIQSILERQTAERSETQTDKECEQLIQNCQKSIQLVNSAFGNADIEDVISKVILELGVASHLNGYKYLITAIRLVMEDQHNIKCITKRLYPNVAKEHKTTVSRAERSIRHAITYAFNCHVDSELYYKIFGYSIAIDKGKATNSHFISAIANYLLRNYNFS